MPSLDWIGKKAVLNHHKEVPFHLLRCDSDLSVGEPDSGNLLVQGDNLLALKALLPYYAGQVRCIYIDPPYNTGNEKWVYNDNVNSPEMKEWLGKVVGMESEDLSRHDKWLCMMYPRLRLLRDFLSEDGVILISLDDGEAGFLRVLLDEIFGTNNRIATIVWNTRNTDNRIKTNLSPDHEYIFVYGKTDQASIIGRIIDRSDFKNPDNDPRGPYVTDPLKGKATAIERPNLHDYSMRQPGTDNIWEPDPAKGWITNEDGYKKILNDNRIWWPPNPKTGWPRKKRFLSETQIRMPASSFWPDFKTQSGAKELDEILSERLFVFPKPIDLIQRIIDYCSPPNSIVLDSFAGSGTTGHAVLKQNAKDDGKRKFILVEMDEAICKKITFQRLKRSIEGCTKEKNITGLGGGFQYCRIGETLFDSSGQIAGTVSFIDLARFVFLKETGLPLPDEISGKSPLIGIHNGIAVYLLYNGVLDDKTAHGGNALTRAVLDILPLHSGPKIIYGTSCRVGESRLMQEQITFRQIPYALKVD
jgi:site-specific DNA-methyltransferase (adenine-specific)/adenine-specific DNA-methyltransferase